MILYLFIYTFNSDELEERYKTCSSSGISLSLIDNDYNEIILKRMKLINYELNEIEIQGILLKITEINTKIEVLIVYIMLIGRY